jgi:hypothetical protein
VTKSFILSQGLILALDLFIVFKIFIGVTAGLLQRSKKHKVQYNPVVLKILS